ncbi:MAG: hypothetical protein FWH02_01545 [Oscillospiraceae bacterium]|nr:hypothetical protein [Oscillospiraceae bacterium]
MKEHNLDTVEGVVSAVDDLQITPLGKMPVMESRTAQMRLSVIAEKLQKNEAAAKLFDELYNSPPTKDPKDMDEKERSAFLIGRYRIGNGIGDLMVLHCFEEACEIIAIYTLSTVEEVQKISRNNFDILISQITRDAHFQSLFMSSEESDRVALSVFSQILDRSPRTSQSGTSGKNTRKKRATKPS